MTRTNATDLDDHWQTPDVILDMITKHSQIDLDPSAGENTSIGETNYRNETVDGTEAEWFGTVFCNPPFSRKDDFLEKAVNEIENTDVIYFITPDSTDTKSWWHRYIAPHSKYTWFSKGRINYINPETGKQEIGVTYGTCISIFGDPDPKVLAEMHGKGDLRKSVKLPDIVDLMEEENGR